MSEMIERLVYVFDDEIDPIVTKSQCREMAIAALTAMRDPTEAMLRAWDAANIQGPQSDKWKIVVWQAMIDAALAD
jgi:hypothetical protein